MLDRFTNAKRKTSGLIALFSAIAFVIFNVLMTIARKEPVPEYNIVDFEFSWTAAQANLILSTWGQLVINQEIIVTYLDFGYLVAYGMMAFGLLLLGLSLVKKHKKSSLVGKYALLLPFIASMCDSIENINLLFMFYGYPSSASAISAFLASFFALIKFSLLGISLLIFVTQIIIFLVFRHQSEKFSNK